MAHFSREFARTFGEPPHRYLLTRRLERAAALLRTIDRRVGDICFLVGLSSVGSFTTSFNRMFGKTPTQYRFGAPPASSRVVVPTCMLAVLRTPPESHVSRRQRPDADRTVTTWSPSGRRKIGG